MKSYAKPLFSLLSAHKISLPGDALPHDKIIEWWYWNGHLEAKGGHRYAFMDCLFRADLKKVNLPFLKRPLAGLPIPYVYFAHSMLSDIGKRRTYKEIQDITFVSPDSFRQPMLHASYQDPLAASRIGASEMAEVEPGMFRLRTARLDLQLESRKKPLLQGGHGITNLCGRKSYYYSLTDLKASGRIRTGNAWIPVKGKAWMDHQWANVSYTKDKWTWFSLQLNNGNELMCVEYEDGHKKERIAGIIDSKGSATFSSDLSFTPGEKTVVSRETKARYPTGWKIDIPEKRISLSTASLASDQEMIFGPINYWEGPVSVSGTMAGKKVSGAGFMELVGYPSDYNALALMERDLAHTLRRGAKAMIKKFL